MSDRPICHRCDSQADVLAISQKDARRATAFPFCSVHDPDPDEYGNRTTWSDKVVIRRYDEPEPEIRIYGRPGSTTRKYNGRVMHVELPDGEGICCDASPSSRKRYDLERVDSNDWYICRRCCQLQWTEDASEDIVGPFLYRLREVLDEADDLPKNARQFVKFPRPAPKQSHSFAEGFESEGAKAWPDWTLIEHPLEALGEGKR